MFILLLILGDINCVFNTCSFWDGGDKSKVGWVNGWDSDAVGEGGLPLVLPGAMLAYMAGGSVGSVATLFLKSLRVLSNWQNCLLIIGECFDISNASLMISLVLSLAVVIILVLLCNISLVTFVSWYLLKCSLILPCWVWW